MLTLLVGNNRLQLQQLGMQPHYGTEQRLLVEALVALTRQLRPDLIVACLTGCVGMLLRGMAGRAMALLGCRAVLCLRQDHRDPARQGMTLQTLRCSQGVGPSDLAARLQQQI